MPIRILLVVRQVFKSVLSPSKILLYDEFEREKLKMIYEQLLKEETNQGIVGTIE